jgi:hypothetical protein
VAGGVVVIRKWLTARRTRREYHAYVEAILARIEYRSAMNALDQQRINILADLRAKQEDDK